ncbi:MAG TPA: hypothetical protein VHX59_22300 [Mycobacteriales bacterium]|jgi:transcriptional regulator with XRE-family HTH domain/tetratricopeptide (TPR) repeat protein|nr:hypothetical protein [Mycobacteriales bacterium]
MATVQCWTGREAKLLRQALRETVRGFAEYLGVDARTVAKWEARAETITLLPDTQTLMDTALRLADQNVRERFQIGLSNIDSATEIHVAKAPAEQSILPTLTDVSVDVSGGLTIAAVLGPDVTLAVMDDYARSVIDRYEIEGPKQLTSEVLALRRLSRELGRGICTTMGRAQLVGVCARQTALLAYMSVNLGRFTEAQQYAVEASVLATAINDRPLLAWIKGTQSFAAYHQHRYDAALNLASAGVRLAGGDAQRIRLLSNGVARAAGKLGKRHLVRQAVDEALALVASTEGIAGITSCIDFEPYDWTRTAANSATAYLSLGDYRRALDLTQALSGSVAASDSDWSRSLVHLDEASALTIGANADLEHAAALGMQALAASATKPITSVKNRAGELAIKLRRRGATRAADAFGAALRDWQEYMPR